MILPLDHSPAATATATALILIADESSGLTAAEMEQVATEVARNAMRRNDDVTMRDIEDAIEQVEQ